MKRKPASKLSIARSVIQLGVFAFVFLGTNVAVLAKRGVNLPFPSFEVHGVCPFGGVETLYALVTGAGFVHKTQASAVILLLVVLTSTLLFGAVFCGWFCPFGTFQEFIGKLGKRLFPKLYNRVPRRADHVLRYVRYAVLVFIVVMTARVGKLVFETFDPYAALMNVLTGEVPTLALIALGIVAVASLFIERPFCRYFCPFGAVLGLVGMVSLFRPRRNVSTCIGCKRCDRSCPMGIEVSGKDAVRDPGCISCYRCMSGQACPKPDTIVLGTRGALPGQTSTMPGSVQAMHAHAAETEVSHEN